MRKHEGLDHNVFADLVGLAFDHADGLLGAGDDEIERRFASLVKGRIDDVLTIDQTDASTSDRVVERNVRKI